MTDANPLGQAPVKLLFFQYYGPALVSMLSVTTHQVINGIILGQQIGREGLAAVGLYGPVVIVLVALALPMMIGGGVLIGKSIGASDYRKVQEVFQFVTTVVLLIGGSIALTAPFAAGPLAAYLAGAAHVDLVENTADYAFWQLLSLPFFFLGIIWGNFVRANNAPKVSRNASMLAAGINIILDLVLIVGLNLGVEGASIATAIALFSGAVYLFVYIFRGNTHYSFATFRFTLRFAAWREFARIGLPSFVSEIAFSSGLLLINQRLIQYGAVAVSAFGVVNYLSFILIRPFTAAMIATLPIISYNIGSKQPDRVFETLRLALRFTFLLGILVALLGVILPGPIIQLFSGDPSPGYRLVAVEAVRLYFLLFLAAGPNFILSAYLQSRGDLMLSVLINLFKGFVLVAACLLVLPGQFGLPGVWLSRSLAEILTLLLAGIYMFFHRKRYFSGMPES